MKTLKVIAFIIGFILILFGFTGFFSSTKTAPTDESGMMVSSSPLNEVNGIAVDSKKQSYIGLRAALYMTNGSNTSEDPLNKINNKKR